MSKKIDCYFNFLGAYNAELVNSCITNCVFTILQIENIKTPFIKREGKKGEEYGQRFKDCHFN